MNRAPGRCFGQIRTGASIGSRSGCPEDKGELDKTPCRGILPNMHLILILLLGTSIFGSSPAQACSRALFKNSEGSVFTGRSMDWMNATATDLYLFPRGLSREGGTSGDTLKWTSKYGSLISSFYNAATADGINEKGLVANLLYLSVSDYGAPEGKPTLNIAAWTQYVLDNFATVAEAVAVL